MVSEENKIYLNTHKRQYPFSDNLYSVRCEIRERRKQFLGSYLSLVNIVCQDFKINEETLRELIEFLTLRTIYFWNNKGEEAETFCKKFYELVIRAVASGEVGNESVDDIIQMAECLVRSHDTFTVVLKNLLPENKIGELFELIDCAADTIDPDSNFEDAVLGAVSVFLGVIFDPLNNTAQTEEVQQ